jgi:hypothetical protein
VGGAVDDGRCAEWSVVEVTTLWSWVSGEGCRVQGLLGLGPWFQCSPDLEEEGWER